MSEIHMIIQGQGNQSILNDNFYTDPNEVYVNNIKNDTCKKYCELPNDLNNITLIFNEEINSSENMFNGLSNIIEIDLSFFDSSLVTNMDSMFKDCTNLQKINFRKINTTSVVDMSSLFNNCKNLISIDLSNFDTHSVIRMDSMFSYCEKIESIDLSSFNTSKVEIMFDLFAYCYSLVSVDVSSFDTSKVISMQGLFYCCYRLKYLDLQNFDSSSLIYFSYAFGNCNSLIYLNLRNFKIINTNDIQIAGTFEPISSNIKYCIEDLDTKNFLIGDINSNCSDICFQENIKISNEDNICIESCDENQFEYNKICYTNCPNNTFQLFKNKYICLNQVPENYYLDENDNLYKECFYLCKKCNKPGNETYNNCDECINDYTFINPYIPKEYKIIKGSLIELFFN